MNEEKEIPKPAPEIDSIQSEESMESASESLEVNTTTALTKAAPITTEPAIQTMEVHTHGHVHEEKKWKEYLFQFLMLFLAVTLGFFVENQREHYIEHVRVKQYARSLVYDLAKDTVMVNRIIREIKIGNESIDQFVAYINSNEPAQLNNLDLFILTASGYSMYRPYTWNRATIEQIKNSGSLRYFSNDSIVGRISAYDAFTRHMDEDFQGDNQRAALSSQMRNQIIDLNYPDAVLSQTRINKDSFMHTAQYTELKLQNRPLLTKDLSNIKRFLNEKLTIKDGWRARWEVELPQLKKDAATLIQLLNEEYHLE